MKKIHSFFSMAPIKKPNPLKFLKIAISDFTSKIYANEDIKLSKFVM